MLTPLDAGKAAAIIEDLKREGVVSVAVSFLNSYINPANESAMRDLIVEHAPRRNVCVDLVRRRAADPRISAHLDGGDERLYGANHRPLSRGLAPGLKQRGFANDPLIMLSNGGVIGIDIARRFPVRMVECGPAAGALAAAYYAEVLGLDRLMSFDMGGTTAKACLIEDRKPLVTGDFEVDRIYRFKEGSGLPMIIPSVDMIEIGAGGGSIASVTISACSRSARKARAPRRARLAMAAAGKSRRSPTPIWCSAC